MASLVFAAIGSAIAGPVGQVIGSIIGTLVMQLLFANNSKITRVGTRMKDLRIQDSAYGKYISELYGTTRLSGNVIWSSGLRETKHKNKSGGKGGGASVTQIYYTYDISFAVAICAGEISAITRIWFNNSLVYDANSKSNKGKMPKTFTVYTGSEVQMPSPVIEAIEGVGNVPAFRGLAYIVFDSLQLEDYGNSMPSIMVQVSKSIGLELNVNTTTVTSVPTFTGTYSGNLDIAHYSKPSGEFYTYYKKKLSVLEGLGLLRIPSSGSAQQVPFSNVIDKVTVAPEVQTLYNYGEYARKAYVNAASGDKFCVLTNSTSTFRIHSESSIFANGIFNLSEVSKVITASGTYTAGGLTCSELQNNIAVVRSVKSLTTIFLPNNADKSYNKEVLLSTNAGSTLFRLHADTYGDNSDIVLFAGISDSTITIIKGSNTTYGSVASAPALRMLKYNTNTLKLVLNATFIPATVTDNLAVYNDLFGINSALYNGRGYFSGNTFNSAVVTPTRVTTYSYNFYSNKLTIGIDEDLPTTIDLLDSYNAFVNENYIMVLARNLSDNNYILHTINRVILAGVTTVHDLCTIFAAKAGVLDSCDFTELVNKEVKGYQITVPTKVSELFQALGSLYGFHIIESEGKLKFKSISSTSHLIETVPYALITLK